MIQPKIHGRIQIAINKINLLKLVFSITWISISKYCLEEPIVGHNDNAPIRECHYPKFFCRTCVFCSLIRSIWRAVMLPAATPQVWMRICFRQRSDIKQRRDISQGSKQLFISEMFNAVSWSNLSWCTSLCWNASLWCTSAIYFKSLMKKKKKKSPEIKSKAVICVIDSHSPPHA